MQGRPLCETSHRTLRARHARHALFALFLILLSRRFMGSISSACDILANRTGSREGEVARIYSIFYCSDRLRSTTVSVVIGDVELVEP